MRRAILLNITFIIITIIFIILSFTIGYFFFLPIFCFLPFTFRSTRKAREFQQTSNKNAYSPQERSTTPQDGIRFCPKCNRAIIVPDAKYCYHCSTEL